MWHDTPTRLVLAQTAQHFIAPLLLATIPPWVILPGGHPSWGHPPEAFTIMNETPAPQ